MSDTSQSGNTGELKVAAKISELGGKVSFPHGSTAYDLVSEFDGKVSRIQVKTGKRERNRTWSIVTSRGRTSKRTYTKDECDFLVICIDFAFYVIPVEDCSKTHIRIWEPGTVTQKRNEGRCVWERYREAWNFLRP
tara:strand:- start:3851 stop:4258 length:408 start_codon:yes stop_codon:yes gene_type:complete